MTDVDNSSVWESPKGCRHLVCKKIWRACGLLKKRIQITWNWFNRICTVKVVRRPLPPPPPYSHSLTVTVYRMNHDRCEQLGRVRTFQGLSTLSMKEDLTFLWIVRRIKKFKFLQPISVQNCSIWLYTETVRKYRPGRYPLFLHLQKILVLSKYLRNEMRSAKMKSFRLNGILRRMFEQSFEEIGEPFVVGRSVGRSVTPFHTHSS